MSSPSNRPGRRGTPVHIDQRPDAGWRVDDHQFEPFHQADDVFNRSWWDSSVRTSETERFFESYRRPLEKWRRARGFKRRDYALRNASWHGVDIFAELREGDDRREGFLDPLTVLRDASEERETFDSPQQAATEIKHVAKTLGASLVGITGADDRWWYATAYSRSSEGPKPNPQPQGLNTVVVIGQAMDASMIATAPSALAGAATGLGYSQDVISLLSVAQYLRNLGYQAVPTLNDTALAIPYAIKAGLGEYGRNGLVITPEYGPNVRFAKIFTDLEMTHDQPIRFGVEEMCQICRACTQGCPASAIPDGSPSDQRFNRSNIKGITKWTVDGEKCFNYWAAINSDCSVCIRVCPYTRTYGRRSDRLWAALARTRWRRLALSWDRRSGRGKRISPKQWWAEASGDPIGDPPKQSDLVP